MRLLDCSPAECETEMRLRRVRGSDPAVRRSESGTEPVRLAESEKVVEIAHRFQLTPWSYFQPDIQYVIHPGGTGDISDAAVIGAQMDFTF